MPDEPTELRTALLEAYPRYVASFVEGLGADMDDTLADAVVEGMGVLDALLETLERTQPEDQRSSPLEAFREALRPIDRALALVGVEPPSVVGNAVPWDRYGLAPGSSQVLGPAAHEAHLKWGLLKAQSLAGGRDGRPAIALLSERGERDAIVDQADGAGYRIVDLPSDERVVFALVSLNHPDASEVIDEAVGVVRVIAYGSRVDDVRITGLRAKGVWKVVETDDVLRRFADVVPPVV